MVTRVSRRRSTHPLALAGLLASLGGVACDRPASSPVVTPDAVVSGAMVVEAPPLHARCTIDTALEPGVPGSPGHLLPSPINPNGQSELAALMRAMQEHMSAMRERIASGRDLGPAPEAHARIRCAWPTTASDRNPTFDAFAVAYLDAVEALHRPGSRDELAGRYEGVVTACLACHAQSCTGPMVAIEKLRMSEPASMPEAAAP